MLEAAAWGLLAATSLVVGALASLWLPIPRRVVALVMGFGAGALVSALAFDLTAEAFERGGGGVTAGGLVVGALAFYLGSVALQRRERRRFMRTPSAAEGARTGGTVIVLGVLLDGIPESFVLGATLLGGAGISVSFLAAVFVSNLPEGIAGARDLADEGHPRGWIVRLWVWVALASAAAAGIGFVLLGGMSAAPVAFVQAFAAGAIITMLADAMFPEAFEHGGTAVGLATVLGFAVAFFLSTAA
jgi:ZIP family zinc transporter